MNIIICECELYWRKVLGELLSKWALSRKIEILINCCTTPREIITYFQKHAEPDVLILDISFDKQEKDGITLAKQIRKMGSSVPIIFIASDPLRAIDGYLVEAIGYLTKPVDHLRFSIFLDRIIKNKKSIHIVKHNNINNINQNNLLYVEIVNHTLIYHTNYGNIENRGALCDVLPMLDANCFVQIHRSYIISLDKIKSIKTTYPYSVILLENEKKTTLPVSRKYIKRLLEVYSKNEWVHAI